MRLARLRDGDAGIASVETQGHWVRTGALDPSLEHMTAALSNLERLAAAIEGTDLERLVSSGQAVAAEDASFAAPIKRPGKLLAIGLNYVDHIREVGAETPPWPLLFGKFPSSMTGPYDDIVVDPRLTEQADYEVELAVVIGRAVRDFEGTEVLPVAGYAVANDLSSRDVQFSESQWVRSKSFDGFCPIGPWITTPDDVGDPMDLALSTTVNGEVRQDSRTKQMLFGVTELIAFLSRGCTLEPGDVILTGTPPGVALGMPNQPWLKPGDAVRCEIEGLGHIENRIVGPDDV